MLEKLSEQIEEIVLRHDSRGMAKIQQQMKSGYCLRAANLLLDSKGTVIIGTGFPVAGTFESDGPIGAIALYQVLSHLSFQPVFVCAPPISRVLSRTFTTHEIPIKAWTASHTVVQNALALLKPNLIVAIERPGITADKNYYNIRGENITAFAAKFDLFFDYGQCPTLAFGDGGNEIGMGNVYEALSELTISPSVTCCDELVVSTVSNWGVYGVIAMMSRLIGEDLLSLFDPRKIMKDLLEEGCLDGVTLRPTLGEDGFDIEVSMSIIEALRQRVYNGHH